MRPLAALPGLLLGLLLALTACGEDAERAEPVDPTAHNEADVEFATEMIQHHAEALVMVDLTLGRKGLDPGVARLAESIRETQAAEIEGMSDWLQEWNEPIPETVRDHVNAEHGEHGHGSGELGELEKAKGQQFEELWLERMIEHHEGAVEMAEQEIEEGSYRPTREMAEQIAKDQAAQIETMRTLLG